MNDHIGDDAELYALGVLDDATRERIDAHLARCGPCSQSVGAAERAALALENVTWDARAPKVRELQSHTFAKLATAAALILLAVSAELGIQNHTLRASVASNDVAIATLATSHFLHASFVARAPGVAPAKAIYARDGAWTYVIVDGNVEGWHVDATAGNVTTTLATLHAHGRTSTAFVQPSRRFDTLALENTTGQTLAAVTLAYPK